jgi:hypothetical protein
MQGEGGRMGTHEKRFIQSLKRLKRVMMALRWEIGLNEEGGL